MSAVGKSGESVLTYEAARTAKRARSRGRSSPPKAQTKANAAYLWRGLECGWFGVGGWERGCQRVVWSVGVGVGGVAL